MENLKKTFSVPIRNENWDNINWHDNEYCTCKPPYEIEKWHTADCYCQKCGRVIRDEDLPK
jgi:hypothetical protein